MLTIKWFLSGSNNKLNTKTNKTIPPIVRGLNLRGRDDDDDIGKLYGFNAESVAEINNKMVDDVKIILAEYRLALKKNDSLFKWN